MISRFAKYAIILMILPAVLLLGRIPGVSAQENTRPGNYWQYSASSRLNKILAVDINQDGTDELLVLDEDNRLTLLSADGQVSWAYTGTDNILALSTVEIPDRGGNNREITLATADSLILLDHTGRELWNIPLLFATSPVGIWAYTRQNGDRDTILVLLSSGRLLEYDSMGNLVWDFSAQEDPTLDVNPQLLIADFDGDGGDEIVLGLFTPLRFSQLIFIDGEAVIWRKSISRRITSIVEAPFSTTNSAIAIGTNFGQIDLYDAAGELLWFRTINVPITTMAFADSAAESALIVGTQVGSVVAFSNEGRRLWTNNLAADADRAILRLSPTTKPIQQTAEFLATPYSTAIQGETLLAVLMESSSIAVDLADVLLLSTEGQIVARVGETDLPYLIQLFDINRDSFSELLLARFSTLQLVGLGVGNREYLEEWEYPLEAAPTATLVLDLNGDGEDEIIVGTSDGRIHAIGGDRTIRWLHAPGGVITHLLEFRGTRGTPPAIAAIRQISQPADEFAEQLKTTTYLELRGNIGNLLWEAPIQGRVTAFIVDHQADEGDPALFLGTETGQLLGFTQDGDLLINLVFSTLNAGIQHLHLQKGRFLQVDQLLLAGDRRIFSLLLQPLTDSISYFANFSERITDIVEVRQSGAEPSASLLVILEDGTVHGLNREGTEMSGPGWPHKLSAPLTAISTWNRPSAEVIPYDLSLFWVATADGGLEKFGVTNNRPVTNWRISEEDVIQALNWDDLDGNGVPDSGIVGTNEGRVSFIEEIHTQSPQQSFSLSLDSNLFYLSLLTRSSLQSPGMLAVTQNGFIRLYQEEENRPPLLTQPLAESDQNQINFSILVNDIEGDTVSIQLELLDPVTGNWLPSTNQELENGNGRLAWPVVNFPDSSNPVTYRYRFNDGLYTGFITPPPGPVPPQTTTFAGLTQPIITSLGILSLLGIISFLRYSQTPGPQAQRFFRRLRRAPQDTLPLLEEGYAEFDGSPDFLLPLANRARLAGEDNVANLIDGLFILSNRPQAGLSIITRTLDDMSPDTEPHLDNRLNLYKTVQALLDAPTITELSLLRPQLVQLVANTDNREEWSPLWENLLPVLSNMRDSERVGSINDRLVYLNQAETRLRQVEEQLDKHQPGVEKTMAHALIRRWSGLLSAEIEEQRGRAELEVTLITKRLAPNGQTTVAMDIRNNGRAAAENIVAVLEESLAYQVCDEPQRVSFLPAGRNAQIRFLIEPRAEERFRVAMSLTYDDRNQREKTTAFGDMVHLLPPARDFTPIANPYLPGTPLRKNNPLFYGREELFNFIMENTGAQSQRNVMMLVGQRRTGKTSALLRLEDYLPQHLLPVYIDCQSLGVTPGMSALLEELAWHIADGLSNRGIECPIPDHAAWETDPTRTFQRIFLPTTRQMLPAETTLLLVFDEFEAFESMVSDGILPPTVFTYLRHLMQHSDWLGFIFVGTRRLEEMSADYWSVLFNTALYRKIDFLSEVEATRLITEPVSPAIIYDDLAIDKILRVTAGHPYFLQLVCYTLVKNANQNQAGYITISDVNAALDEMLRLGEVHFAYLWHRSNYAERAILSAIAHLMDRNEPLQPETFVEYLRSFSIELEPTSLTTALSSLVERDILREVNQEGFAFYELRIGLVGLWVSQNKSLSRLLAQ